MEIFKLVGSIVVDDSQAKQSIGNIKGEASGLSGVFQKAGGAVGGFVSSIGKIAGAVGVFKVVDGAINMITNSFDSAISRVDTLNQFPRVLEQMGVEGEDARASMEALSEGIQGLPTTLDDIAGSTQRMFTILGDIDLATESTLALNNAFLASGASQADASRGTEQYLQMLSAGKVDMQSWRTLQETMPYALNETAEAFGFTGQSAQNDFYDALMAGEITMDDFNAKMIELSEGTGGFAEMAQEGTRGIATSWQNIQTAVTTGVANIIQAFDDWLASNGFGGIPEVLDKIKESVQGAFSTIVEWVPIALDWINQFREGLSNGFDGEGFNLDGLVGKVTEFLPILVEKGKEIFNSLLQGVLDNLPMIANIAVDIINGLISGLGERYAVLIPAGIEILVALIDGLIQALPLIMSVAFQTIGTLVETLMGLLPTIIDAGMTLLTALIDGFTNNLPALVSMALTLIMFIVDSLMSQLPAIIQAGITMINALVDGLIQMMPVLVPMAMEIINTLLGAILQNLPVIIQAGIQLLVALINGIVSMLPMLVAQGINLIISLIGAILSNLPLLISAGIQVLIALISGIIQTIPQLISTALQLPYHIIAGFAEVNWLGIGADIIKGVINGIMGMGGALFDAAKNIVSSAFNGVKNFLGIKSPSKLFRDEIGKWIPAGIAVGIEDNADLPFDALNKVIGVEGYDMRSTVKKAEESGSAGVKGGRGDITQNVTIVSPKSTATDIARRMKKQSQSLALEF